MQTATRSRKRFRPRRVGNAEAPTRDHPRDRRRLHRLGSILAAVGLLATVPIVTPGTAIAEETGQLAGSGVVTGLLTGGTPPDDFLLTHGTMSTGDQKQRSPLHVTADWDLSYNTTTQSDFPLQAESGDVTASMLSWPILLSNSVAVGWGDFSGTYEGGPPIGSAAAWTLSLSGDLTLCEGSIWYVEPLPPPDESCHTTPATFEFVIVTDSVANAYGTYTQTDDSQTGVNVGDLVETVPGFIRASQECEQNGGTRVVDSTNSGVRTFVYAHQPSADEVWLCTRVEDTSTGDGFGGRLVVTPGGGVPSISGGPSEPSTDANSGFCTNPPAGEDPNEVPTAHPISHGGVGPVDYMVDAYANDSEAWLCVEVDSEQHRVVVPFDDPVPQVDFGTVVTWEPDEGTPS